MAKKLEVDADQKKWTEHQRKHSVQVNFRISPEEDRILWAIQHDRSLRNRTHAVRYFMLLGLKAEGKLDPKRADQMIEDAKFGRYYDNTPVLEESAAASRRRSK